jgi:hypothetical protein
MRVASWQAVASCVMILWIPASWEGDECAQRAPGPRDSAKNRHAPITGKIRRSRAFRLV